MRASIVSVLGNPRYEWGLYCIRFVYNPQINFFMRASIVSVFGKSLFKELCFCVRASIILFQWHTLASLSLFLQLCVCASIIWFETPPPFEDALAFLSLFYGTICACVHYLIWVRCPSHSKNGGRALSVAYIFQCFGQGLKICMRSVHNPDIIFYHFWMQFKLGYARIYPLFHWDAFAIRILAEGHKACSCPSIPLSLGICVHHFNEH